MPFYEYECSACKFYVEVLQKLSDPQLKKCPSCKKPTMKRLVSAPVFRLKGSGWYETDFKSDQDKKRNLVGEDKDTSAPEAKPEASDTKPEAKADTKDKAPSKPEKSAAKAAPKKPAAKSKAKSPAKKK